MPDILFVKLCGIIYAWLLKRLNFLFNILSLSLHLKFRESLTSLSGTFKAKYKGIYQFSVTLLCGARSDLHFELVRGTPGFGTKVLAVGKVKNRDMHHTNQVTVTVFAELSPNDTVKVKTKAVFLPHPWRNVSTRSLNFKNWPQSDHRKILTRNKSTCNTTMVISWLKTKMVMGFHFLLEL